MLILLIRRRGQGKKEKSRSRYIPPPRRPPCVARDRHNIKFSGAACKSTIGRPCCIWLNAPTWTPANRNTSGRLTRLPKPRGAGQVLPGGCDVTGPLVLYSGIIQTVSPPFAWCSQKKLYIPQPLEEQLVTVAREARRVNVIYVSTQQRNDHGQACGPACGLVAPSPPAT